MKPIATGILIVLLATGGLAAQTAGEQARILRDFQQRVTDAMYHEAPAPPIFTPPVAMVFRQMIAHALADHPAVLQPLPVARLDDFPTVLADALPLLPEPLEYRLFGHDLVVTDRESQRVVGVLREAVGTAYPIR